MCVPSQLLLLHMRSVWHASRIPRTSRRKPPACPSRSVSTTCKKKPHVVLGMSGGVDSSVSAHLLLQKNYAVTGIYMHNWDTRDERGECPSERDWQDVKDVCARLGIPCHRIDLSREYWVKVFDDFLERLRRGETPNPDVDCNREIKFGAFFDRVAALPWVAPADYVATGHYARVQHSVAGGSRLLRPLDSNKDQTYYLSTIQPRALRRTLFPLGNYTKQTVKEIARSLNLVTASKPESMGICFIGKRQFGEFLDDYIPSDPGDIVSVMDRKVMGHHDGVWKFTVGQRARLGGEAEKWYVADKDHRTKVVLVAPGRTHPSLYRSSLNSGPIHWILGSEPVPLSETGKLDVDVKYRYRTDAVKATLAITSSGPQITFREPQHSVAVGQHLAIYDDEVCLGGARIEAVGGNGCFSGVA